MTQHTDTVSFYRFGEFRFGVSPYLLSRLDGPVEITPQQAQLLELLLEQGGEVVPREAIRERLWPQDVHVDFDRSINYCITRLRAALDDRSDTPRYIETVPRRGYRFVGALHEPASETEPFSTTPREASRSRSPARVRATWILLSAVICGPAAWLGLRDFESTSEQEPAEPTVERACDAFGVGAADLPPPAAEAFQKGCYFASRSSLEDRARAIEAFDVVLLHHPDFEPALSYQAKLYARRHDWSRAAPLAERAVRSAPDRVDSLVVLAEASFRLAFDWPEAEARFRSALEIYPRHLDLRMGYANLLSAMGLPEEAVPLAKKTVAMHPMILAARAELAEELYLAGEFEAAHDLAEAVVRVDPRFVAPFMISHYSLLALGRHPEALAQSHRMLEAWGWPAAPTADLKGFYQLLIEHQTYGDQADQRQLSELAVQTLLAGKPSEARALMKRACAERSGWSLPYYDVDPRFRPFHEEPGLESLATCLREPFDLGRASRQVPEATEYRDSTG